MLPVTRSHDCLRWYVVQTKPRQEARAETNLRRLGLEMLAPRLRESRATGSAKRLVQRVVPLFPGYIFSRFDEGTLLARVRLTRGVHKVVGFGESATPVDDTIIALIQDRIGNDGFVEMRAPRHGETVRIVAGPLESLEGVFERRLHSRDRVLILIASMASQTRIQVPLAYVQRTPIRSAAS
jgi:transcriptional antiterminator RfaH